MKNKTETYLKIATWGNILYKFNKYVLSHKDLDPKDTILIAGTPRSGTTWFEEMVINFSSYTFLHEPLQPVWFPDSIKAGFNARSSYIPVDSVNKKAERYIRKILTGKVYSYLPAYRFEAKMIMDYLLGDKLLVKSVRMNRILPWVASNFETKHLYLVIRHPCAVISSQLKSGFIGYHSKKPPFLPVFPTVKNIVDDAGKIENLDSKVITKLKKIKTKEEILAVAWCLDTFVPLNCKKPRPWTTIFYEKCIKDRDKIISNIFDEIGLEKPSDKDIIYENKPSMSASWSEESKSITNADKQLSKWKRTLSEKQINNILKIVKIFDLDFYTENIEPDYKQVSI